MTHVRAFKPAMIMVLACVVLSATRAPLHAQVPERSAAPANASQETPAFYVVLGSTAGWLAGLAAGAALGYALQPETGDSYIGAVEWWIGAWIGSSVGSSVGAHLANGSRGSVAWGIVASFAVVPVAALAGAAISASEVTVPVAQIGISVIVERKTGARRD